MTRRLTWLTSHGDVARGTNSGCVAALRPRGSARVARAGGAQDAPSGREDMPRERPCGAPRIGSVIDGKETINRGINSPIYTHHFPLFSSCGTMFPHGLTLQVTWTCGERRISPRTATIAWTRVHAIIKSARAKKKEFKWMRSMAYLLPRGASPERPIVIAGSSDVSHRTVAIFRDPGDRGAPCGSRSDRPLFLTLHRTIQMPRGRTPRSRSDRTAIAARSSRDRGVFDAESTPRSSDRFS